jgi:hypothetical protein
MILQKCTVLSKDDRQKWFKETQHFAGENIKHVLHYILYKKVKNIAPATNSILKLIHNFYSIKG